MASYEYQELGAFTVPSGVTCTNKCVLMDKANNIQILGRFQVSSFSNGMIIANDFPSFARLVNSNRNIRIPVGIGNYIGTIAIEAQTGIVRVYCPTSISGSAYIMSEGIMYNVSMEYYNDANGNNYPNMPLD